MVRTGIIGAAVLALVAGAVAFSTRNKQADLVIEKEKANPWTNLELNNDPDQFQFAIVSDRTGGHRAQVFSQAVARINLMQPQFVLCVGDLIEGGKKKPEQVLAEWKEFDGYVNQLQMPFYYVPGNHDVAFAQNDKIWQDRYGRRWYHFVYRKVLFLCLNTEDPPGSSSIGKEQVAYAKKALEDNKDVRHTIVALHKPVWTYPEKTRAGWLEVEKALADRKYTVFCGHVHRYRKYVRQGRNYYQLATTGGGSKMRGVEYGEFDHVVWVTMKKDGPVFANLLLDGILPDDLKTPESSEKGQARKLLKTVPVRGEVCCDGGALPGAYLTFTRIEDKGGTAVRGDAMSEGDGSFRVSTYSAFDGLPEGKYAVTAVQRRPFRRQDGSDGPNLLPEKYAAAKTSGLTIEVKQGMGPVRLELKR
jgi:hypothetical protein